MKYSGFKILSFVLFGSVLVTADPFLTLNFDKFEVTKQVENPYMRNFQAYVTKAGKQSAATLGFEILDLPPEMQGIVKITMNGITLPAFSGNVCNLLDNNKLLQGLVAEAEPKNRLNKGCPVNPGTYILKDYMVDTKLIPLGVLPDGIFTLILMFGMPGEEPFVAYTLRGSASHFGLG